MTRSLVAINVKNIIAKKGLKQYVVAERCGYTARKFSDLLNGRKLMKEQDIINLCTGLEINPDELFGFDKQGT